MKPNLDQVLSLIRAILAIVGTAVVARNPTFDWESISGAILVFVPIIWSMFVHTDAGKIRAASDIPGVKVTKDAT